MDEVTKQRIAERIAERKRLGMTAEQFDRHCREAISDAAGDIRSYVGLGFKAGVAGNRGMSNAFFGWAMEADRQHAAAVAYAKKYGAVQAR